MNGSNWNGPWMMTQKSGDSGRERVEVSNGDGVLAVVWGMKNARLIVTAPTLYKYLEDAIDRLAETGRHGSFLNMARYILAAASAEFTDTPFHLAEPPVGKGADGLITVPVETYKALVEVLLRAIEALGYMNTDEEIWIETHDSVVRALRSVEIEGS